MSMNSDPKHELPSKGERGTNQAERGSVSRSSSAGGVAQESCGAGHDFRAAAGHRPALLGSGFAAWSCNSRDCSRAAKILRNRRRAGGPRPQRSRSQWDVKLNGNLPWLRSRCDQGPVALRSVCGFAASYCNSRNCPQAATKLLDAKSAEVCAEGRREPGFFAAFARAFASFAVSPVALRFVCGFAPLCLLCLFVAV